MFAVFGLFGFVFVLSFVAIAGFFVYMIAKGIGQWQADNASPIVTAAAHVVAKRTAVSGSSNGQTGGSTFTTYYVTFEFEGGDRREFGVGGKEHGLLAEGDRGQLTSQGSRYKGFQRERTGGFEP